MLESLPEFTLEDAHCIKDVVILATPSLAHVLEPKDFLHSIIARVYAQSEKPKLQESSLPELDREIKTLSAIVDALPLRGTAAAQQHGPEGFSILFSSGSVFSEPDLLRSAGDEDVNYTLRFMSSYNADEPRICIEGTRPYPIRYLTLPVANTIFVNGYRATLFQDIWKVSFNTSSRTSANDQEWVKVGSHISHERRQHLRTATIRADFHSHELGRCVLPLTPLTEPRKITKAMGNVVTEIQLPERKAPASAELESRVSKYLSDNPHATAAGPLLIYAAVCPPPTTAPLVEKLPQDQLRSLNFLDTFNECTRLFRVTGGGGGWGKKQGLLSLDPAVDFDGHGTTTSDFPDIDDDVDDIGQLFEPKGMMPLGSTIQFWVWDNNNRLITQTESDYLPDLDPTHEKQYLRRVLDGDDKMNFVLGTGPRAEEREGIEEQGAVIPNKSRISRQCLYGYFGMLTYGGAALGSVDLLEDDKGAHTLWMGARSRVDVPNTTFVLDVGLLREKSLADQGGQKAETATQIAESQDHPE